MWLFLLGNLRLIFVIGTVLTAVIGTWTVQDWRYASREATILKAQQEYIQKEAAKQAKAAVKFEKKQEQLNEVYKTISKALKDITDSTLCFNPERLRIINNALGRAAADPAGSSGAVP